MRLRKSSDWRTGAKIYLISTACRCRGSALCEGPWLASSNLGRGNGEESLEKANANRPNAGKAGEAHMAVILLPVILAWPRYDVGKNFPSKKFPPPSFFLSHGGSYSC